MSIGDEILVSDVSQLVTVCCVSFWLFSSFGRSGCTQSFAAQRRGGFGGVYHGCIGSHSVCCLLTYAYSCLSVCIRVGIWQRYADCMCFPVLVDDAFSAVSLMMSAGFVDSR